ncbi:hypothetical protein [Pseudodesulfovibrio pelocollis]|uniref:hypothetical protein n=1 Tax=Pseudodesulfovibrio pelocollis TaxID=3051432 RepID=UPI00255A8F6A|nr:hypothetical protein [Pseudodesulfovibrio sp. SB368]
MDPLSFFSTSNRKKIAAYLIEKGNHLTTFKKIESSTGVMYRTLRDILGKAEAAGFLEKEMLTGDDGKGIRIELKRPMLDCLDELRLACQPTSTPLSRDETVARDLLELRDEDYKKLWPKLFDLGWTPRLTGVLISRLSTRGIPVGGLHASFDHMEHILTQTPPNKPKKEILMNFFRGLDDKGYIAIPPGFVPDEVADIVGND